MTDADLPIQLSPRLQAIADAVPPGTAVADIGTDHGLVPAYLGLHGRNTKIVAADRRQGPLRAAARTFARCGLPDIELRLGDGLRVLVPGEVSTVVLAGMGAHRMFQLLDEAPAQTAALRHLVLAPNTAWAWTRRAIAARRWSLRDETLVTDAGSFYVVLRIDVHPEAPPEALSEQDFEFGPSLRRHPTPTFVAFLEQVCRTIETTLAVLPSNVGPDHPRRLELLDQRDRVRAERDAAVDGLR